MLNGPGLAEAGGMQSAIPPAVKAVTQELKQPAGQKVATPEAGKNGAEVSPGEAGKKTDGAELTAEAVIEVANTIKEAADLQNVVPEAYENGLRAIASGGDLAQNFELSGQAVIEKAISAPKEGEGALTTEQRKQMMADGYDMEIGGLQLKLARAKKPFGYNFYIQPYREPVLSEVEGWFLRIIPRFMERAGFELSTGIMVNSVEAKKASEELKNIL